jgi:isocitrate dehydrogenase
MYAKALGSAVNPVLREGNSDRRVAKAVKDFAKKNPHKLGKWTPEVKTHVSYMSGGDYYGTEQSQVCEAADTLKIEFIPDEGVPEVLKEGVKVLGGEVIDSSVMSIKALTEYLEAQMQDAKEKDLLFSLHLKATMMKVSDPIFFGHAVKVYYKDVFEKYGAKFAELGVNVNNGIGDVYAKIQKLPEAEQKEIKDAITKVYETRPAMAMVDSDNGITNLHVPSDIIIDASMPVVVRDSGCMWTPDNKLKETKCCIPDRCYAPMYDSVFDNCRKNGQFDVTTMGNVPNVGLMAQKAEEYGSHDKTFEMKASGIVKVVDSKGASLMNQKVDKGDVFRMCQVKDAPIRDWVSLAVRRARATSTPAVFWLDEKRAHDRNIIAKVQQYLKLEDTNGLELLIKDPVAACIFSMDRARAGNDTISVTGNVLRDYLTDLFPIIELGTSAKMLSIVPMLSGGGMYETGAGGSAPKHVQQFVAENHLRWDSLGEFLALAISLEDLGTKLDSAKIKVLGKALDDATGTFLDEGKNPSRKAGQIDNRGSHFYLCLYWAEKLAAQDADAELKAFASPLAEQLRAKETEIIDELNKVQGGPADIGGYYRPDVKKTLALMRPCKTFNDILASFSKK